MMNDATDTSKAEQGQEDSIPEVSLDEQLKARDEEIAGLKDRLLRTVAETENVRRRLEREKQDASSYAVTGFARDMLGVADNLRRALESVPAEARESGSTAALLAGVEATERELLSIFAKHGISRIESIGQPLDPNRHQAMIELESTEAAPGTVVEEMQPGYVLRDRLLRPSLVAVAKSPANESE